MRSYDDPVLPLTQCERNSTHMKIIERFYVSDGLKEKRLGIDSQLQQNKLPAPYYVLLVTNDRSPISICKWRHIRLFEKHYDDAVIFGVAKNKVQAFELLRSVWEQCIRITGNTDIKAFISGSTSGKDVVCMQDK